ncbi:imidazoleglycerol-phosphate dehydratase HisB [Candidatus Magnetominusculus dajiuhuensis]|uniref:imidazoleglycerol-phosphate dehydratase HisB n=1 Tax=Candidatus Magnetominusculus dajiuhuensis TaxID=3137712 RepID=UPI003B4382D0
MRKSNVHRETTETNVTVGLNLDEYSASGISTQIPFLNHMLDLASRHGHFTLKVDASGDTDVDYHHLMEDIGITLGDAINKAVGDKHGINRYGSASVPMDESLAEVIIDLSGRPYLVYNVSDTSGFLKDLQVSLFEDFFRGLCSHGLFNLHIRLHYGRDTHHIYEAIFKAFGRALSAAAAINPKTKGVPSTKGTL